MAQRAITVLFLASITIVACSAGTSSTSFWGEDGGADGAATSTSPTDGKDGAIGSACQEYLACCTAIAESAPQLAASCDSVKAQIENAEKNGVSAKSFESACKSGVDGFKAAGYCKPVAPVKKCVTSCTKDADCANSCPSIPNGVQCCDTNTKACFGSKTLSCPKPADAGIDPPPSY